MLEKLERAFSGRWEILFVVLFFPLYWFPWLIEGELWLIVVKILFLALPILLFIIGFWFSMVSLITVFFRPHRVRFSATILITWWDGGKAVVTYWGGIFKFCFMAKILNFL